MMKPTSNYKMSKAGKINLAMNWAKPGRAARKRSIVQAELSALIVVRPKKDRE